MENKIRNTVEFKVSGKYALFTDPLTKVGGEKCSYHIPTYEALKGILSSVYWKPTFVWIIDRVRIMKPIRTQTRSTKPLKFAAGGNDLSIYTYLANVEYQVQAHFEWNIHREDLAQDRNENKHHCVVRRMIERGGRRDVFLGTRECQGYVEPCIFGEGEGEYDSMDELAYGLMFHGFDYPDETGKHELHARFWRPVMRKGIIDFIRPDERDEQKMKRKFIRTMVSERPITNGLSEEGLLEECDNMEVTL